MNKIEAKRKERQREVVINELVSRGLQIPEAELYFDTIFSFGYTKAQKEFLDKTLNLIDKWKQTLIDMTYEMYNLKAKNLDVDCNTSQIELLKENIKQSLGEKT